MAKLFYLTRRTSGGNYYVKLRLEDGSISSMVCTGTPNKCEAEKFAYQLISSGNIPRRPSKENSEKNTISVEKLSFFTKLKVMEFDREDVQKIVDILVDRKYLVSGILKSTPESKLALDFLIEFWTYECSPYVKEMKVRGSSLTRSYFKNGLGRIRNYWADRLEGKYLGEITPDDVTAIYQDPKLDGLATKTIKGIIDAVTIPMKWAHRNHLTQIVGFNEIPRIKLKSKEREILPMRAIPEVFSVKWENDMCRLANLLAMYTGMRASEVQAVRVEDLHETYIHVAHAWDKCGGIKSTKNGEERDCPISIELYNAMMEQVKFNPWYGSEKEKAFIFFGDRPAQPVTQRGFNKYLHRALEAIGYENPEAITFHCWRHEFCTEAKTIVNDDRIIRAVSGHKSQQMFEHYSKHVEHLQTLNTMGNAADELFGDVVRNALKSTDQEKIAITA